MRLCLRYANLFWAIAIFLMAGGQVAHAVQDFCCWESHAEEGQPSDAGGQPTQADHSCCHGHIHGKYAPLGSAFSVFVNPDSVKFADKSESVVEGPAREIDHPPQLS